MWYLTVRAELVRLLLTTDIYVLLTVLTNPIFLSPEIEFKKGKPIKNKLGRWLDGLSVSQTQSRPFECLYCQRSWVEIAGKSFLLALRVRHEAPHYPVVIFQLCCLNCHSVPMKLARLHCMHANIFSSSLARDHVFCFSSFHLLLLSEGQVLSLKRRWLVLKYRSYHLFHVK